MLNYQYTTIKDGQGASFPFPWFSSDKTLDTAAVNNIKDMFNVRDEDIFIVAYPKSGTAWMRQIVHLLVSNAEQGEKTLAESVPLLEKKVGMGQIKSLEKTKGQRCFMSHLPYSLMPGINKSRAKYIYMLRNPKDVAVSFYHFMSNREPISYTGDWNAFFDLFVSGRVLYGLWFSHVTEWWKAAQKAENILIVTYEDMHKDLDPVIARISAFLNIPASQEMLNSIAIQSTFTSMQTNSKTNWQSSDFPDKHLRKGKVGDWKNHFTPEQNVIFDAAYKQKMADLDIQIDFELKK
jgi:hypothetical protein